VLGLLTYFFLAGNSAGQIGRNAGPLLLACAALLILLRDPALFTQPRFWAEEAVIYFRTAWLQPTWVAMVEPHQGYFSLFANLAGVIATGVPIEHAPAVTTLLAAMAQLAIVGAIVIADAPGLRTWAQKAWATVATLVVGATGEIWLTTINTQHWLPLLIFVILIDDKTSPAKCRLWYLAAALAGLSGVAANFLGPLFLARYLHRRNKADLWLFVILTTTACIQLTAIGYSIVKMGTEAFLETRHSPSPGTSPATVLERSWYNGVTYPLFGNYWRLQAIAPWLLLASCVAAWQASRRLCYHYAAIVLLSLLTVVGSMGMSGSPRYAYPGAVLVSLLLLQIAGDPELPTLTRRFAGAVLLISLLYWCHSYQSGMKKFRDQTWPVWSDEARVWRTDPSHPLQAHPVWPQQTEAGIRWTVTLPSKP